MNQAADPVSIGPYRIVRRLGQGGMGTVYLAVDQADRNVAVKVINADLAGDPVFRGRFRRDLALEPVVLTLSHRSDGTLYCTFQDRNSNGYGALKKS